MDKLTSPESKRVTVISDIILTSRDGTLEESEVVDITFDDIDGGTQEESFNTPVGSRPFKNLFESPIEHVSKKRKQEFLLAKNEEKRIRFENEINKENENEEEEEEEEVEKEFNYMTGTYEPVKKPVAPKSDENNKTQSLHTSVKEICHVNENRAEAGIVQSSDTVVVLSKSNLTNKNGNTHGSQSINIGENNIIRLGASPSIPEINSFQTSQGSGVSCQGDNSNHSINSNHSAHRNESSNDSIIAALADDSVLENSSSSTVVKSNDSTSKELVINLDCLPISSLALLNAKGYEKNYNSEQSSSSFNKKNWKCNSCGFSAKTKNELMSHIYVEHLKDDYEIKIKCKSCDFECTVLREMEQHELSHARSVCDETNIILPAVFSPEKSDLTGDAVAKRSSTKERCKSDSIITNLETQEAAVITENDEDSADILKSDDDLPLETEKKRLQCFFCQYTTNRRLHLSHHAGRHNGKIYYCDDHFWVDAVSFCPKCIFENIMHNLQRYLLTCKICGYSTTRGFYFKIHVAKPFSCQQYIARKAKEKKLESTTECVSENVTCLKNAKALSEIGCDVQNEGGAAQTTTDSDDFTVPQTSLQNNFSNTESSEVQHVIYEESVENKDQGKDESSNKELQEENLPNAGQNTEETDEPCSNTKFIETANPDADNCGQSCTDISFVPSPKHIKEEDAEDLYADASDGLEEGEFALVFKCFDCDASISKKDELKTHALSSHADSSFRCDIHKSKRNFYECEKCIYELIFKTSGKEQLLSTEDTSDVSKVSNIKARTFWPQVVNTSDVSKVSNIKARTFWPQVVKCTRSRLNKRARDSDSDDSSNNEATEVRTTRGRSLRSKVAVKQNQEEASVLSGANDSFLEETARATSGSKNSQGSQLREESPDLRQCFDCNCFLAQRKFLRHVCRHIGSKFQCLKHEINHINCDSCHYESIINTVRAKALICKVCGFATCDNYNFKRHITNESACFNWTQRTVEGKLKCFHCWYVTSHKNYLKHHMVDHLDQTLSACTDHKRLENRLCLRCINVHCLESAKKEVKICKECNFKTVSKQVFDRHKCKEVTKETAVLSVADKCDNFENDDNTQGSKIVASRNKEQTPIIINSQENDKCFDCKSSNYVIPFNQHVTRHIGSKYQCVKHWKSKCENCPKCKYEQTLQNLRTRVKTCNICSYRTLRALQLTKHLEEFGSCTKWVNRKLQPGEIRCLQCQYVTSRRKFLKYHMVDHSDVTFFCDLHHPNKNERCEKCINEKCLIEAKTEVKACQRCSFKTVIKQIFDIHNCTGEVTEQSVLNEVNENAKKGSLENTQTHGDVDAAAKNKRDEVRCFDCKYFCTDKDFKYKKHVSRHVGSKYQCMEHLKDKLMDSCEKCYYEVVLKDLKKDIKSCATCGYRTIQISKMDKHKNGTGTCEKWIKRKLKSGDVKCFECHYVTSRKRFLNYHMVDHLDVEFVCKKHDENKDEECLECIYEQSLKSAKKDAVTCEKCNFKTVIKKVFKTHECVDQRSDDSISENVDSPQKYSCFDCNEFTSHSKNGLGEHALLHYQSNFECTEHSSGEALENCSKCIYQNVLANVKNSVRVCETCFFRACSVDSYANHDCNNKKDKDHPIKDKQDDNAPKFICYHCSYQSNHRASLKEHAVRHYGEEFNCDDHYDVEHHCKKCIYAQVLKGLSTSLKVCDKCQYRSLSGFDYQDHVCEIGSKFKCPDHIDNEDTNCSKCIYEDLVKNFETNTYTCSTCGFKSYTLLQFRCHEKNKVKCQMHQAKLLAEGKRLNWPQIQTYGCFDCDFIHQRKDFLLKHLRVHANSTFQCDEHKEPLEDCLKCWYREEINKNKSLPCTLCFDCTPPASFSNNSSLSQHIYRRHPVSFYVCTSHNKKSDKCLECKYQYFAHKINGPRDFVCCDCKSNIHFDNKFLLKNHIKEFHLKSDFICNNHKVSKRPDICSMCLYRELVLTCESEDISDQPSTSKGRYQCFDCDFKSTLESALSNHIHTNHMESDFSCAEHKLGNMDVNACAKCQYESVLVSFKQSFALKCSKCEFESVNKEALDKHYEQHHSKATFMNAALVREDFGRKKLDKFTCFHCVSFVTNSQTNLFSHLNRSSHSWYDISKFKCKKHRLYDNICERCVFTKLSERARENRKDTKDEAKN